MVTATTEPAPTAPTPVAPAPTGPVPTGPAPTGPVPVAPARVEARAPSGAELSGAELTRYSRHLLLPEVGIGGQQRMAAARVLLVGAGGLGSPVLLYLAAAGIGTIGVIDPDEVDLSNLARQVVHGTDDVGRRKVDSAADRAREVNPHIRVEPLPVAVEPATAVELVRGWDVVVDGTDTFGSRYMIGDACEVAGVPCVWGSVLRFAGQVSVFWSGHGPVYRDLHPVPPPAGSVPSCAEAGVVGAVCGTIGSLMATEVVKLVAGVGDPLVGRVLVHDALAGTFRTLTVRPDPTRTPVTSVVPVNTAEPVDTGPGDALPTITAAELADRLAARAAGTDDFVLVDVREPGERAVNAIPGSVRVPREALLAGRADTELDPAVPVVLHCKTGGRSGQVLSVLRAGGRTDAVHLAGGITAWLDFTGSDQPRY